MKKILVLALALLVMAGSAWANEPEIALDKEFITVAVGATSTVQVTITNGEDAENWEVTAEAADSDKLTVSEVKATQTGKTYNFTVTPLAAAKGEKPTVTVKAKYGEKDSKEQKEATLTVTVPDVTIGSFAITDGENNPVTAGTALTAGTTYTVTATISGTNESLVKGLEVTVNDSAGNAATGNPLTIAQSGAKAFTVKPTDDAKGKTYQLVVVAKDNTEGGNIISAAQTQEITVKADDPADPSVALSKSGPDSDGKYTVTAAITDTGKTIKTLAASVTGVKGDGDTYGTATTYPLNFAEDSITIVDGTTSYAFIITPENEATGKTYRVTVKALGEATGGKASPSITENIDVTIYSNVQKY